MTCGKDVWMSAAIIAFAFAVCGSPSVPAQEGPSGKAPRIKIDAWAPSLAFAPDGKALSCDLSLRAVASGKELARGELSEEHPGCTHVAFSPDGRRLVSIHFDRHLIHAGTRSTFGTSPPVACCARRRPYSLQKISTSLARNRCTTRPSHPMAGCWPRAFSTARPWYGKPRAGRSGSAWTRKGWPSPSGLAGGPSFP